MMRQSEFKKKLDPELGRYTRQHIYGEGIKDVFKTEVSKLIGKTTKSAAKKTGENVVKKAGDKIVQMLSNGGIEPTKKRSNKKVTFNKNDEIFPSKKITQQEINQRVNSIISGGKII